MRTPSIGPLMIALFVCILAFANFETTISILLRGQGQGDHPIDSPFHFSFNQITYTFAYIGLTLTLAQGVLVRRLSGYVPEGVMASIGAILDIGGFLLMERAISQGGIRLLFAALTVVVCGFAMMMPSLNSLISRRSDPARQGGVLGVSQSVSALARILGPLLGIPLLVKQPSLPYWTAAGLMTLGLVLVIIAARGGRDYGTSGVAPTMEL